MTQDPTAPLPENVLPPRMARRRIGRTVLLSLVIFLSGAACGWVISRILPPRDHGPGDFPPDPPVDRIVRQMSDELLLSDEQIHRITDIYHARFAAIRSIRDELFPRFNEQYEQLRNEVRGVLTPAQFARWNVRFDAVRNRMLPHPPPPPPPPPPPREQ